MEPNPIIKREMLQVVDNQLHDNDPPETRQTLNRLLAEGFSEQEARELIAAAVFTEMYYILKSEEPFNEKRYVAALRRLPDLPG